MSDQKFMTEAYGEAIAAGERGECPVGAVLVKDGVIIARAGNEELARKDPTAHAEILCLRRAGEVLGRHFFPDCTMYSTLWPCPMCEGAMLQAQVPKVVSGCRTFKWIMENRFDRSNLMKVGPVMEKKCRSLFLKWAKANRKEILEQEDPG